jgi:hypothetical protein
MTSCRYASDWRERAVAAHHNGPERMPTALAHQGPSWVIRVDIAMSDLSSAIHNTGRYHVRPRCESRAQDRRHLAAIAYSEVARPKRFELLPPKNRSLRTHWSLANNGQDINVVFAARLAAEDRILKQSPKLRAGRMPPMAPSVPQNMIVPVTNFASPPARDIRSEGLRIVESGPSWYFRQLPSMVT